MEIAVALIIVAILAYIVISAVGPTKSPLRLQPENIEPVDQPIKTNDAKKVCREYLKQNTSYDREEISESVRCLTEEIRLEAEALQDDIGDAKEELDSCQRELAGRGIRKRSIPNNSEEVESLRLDIDELMEEIEHLEGVLATAKSELKLFRSDKRKFLCDYINSNNWL